MTLSKHQDIPALPKDPAAAMQEMMNAIDSLRTVYIRENDALASYDTKSFLELQDEKLAAAKIYQRRIEEILGRKNEIKNVNPATKARLEKMQAEFVGLVNTNKEAIGRMQRCMGRLGETISAAARDAAKKQRTFSYGQSGQIKNSSTRSVSMGLSETA